MRPNTSYQLLLLSDQDMQSAPNMEKSANSQQQKPKQVSSNAEGPVETAAKKVAPKVVKNPLFGPSSIGTAPKKQKGDPLKLSGSAIKVEKEPIKSEPKQKQIVQQPKKEQPQRVQLVRQVDSEKKQQARQEHQLQKQKETKDKCETPEALPLKQSPKQSKHFESPAESKATKETEEIKTEQTEKKEIIRISRNLEHFMTEQAQVPESQHIAQFKITQTILKGKTIYYKVEGNDEHGPFQVYRKYAEFQSLRKLVRERWPGCFIPAVTNKSDLKNSSERDNQIKFILQNFLLGLSYSNELYYKEEVQLFLRSPDIDIHDMVEQMPVLKVKDVMNRFASSYGEDFFETKVDSNQIKTMINSLRKIANHLATLSSKLLPLCESYDTYALSMSRFAEFTKTYQHGLFLEYSNGNKEKIISSKSETKNFEKLQEFSRCNPFYLLYASLNSEARDALSFVQILIATDIFGLRKEEVSEEAKQLQKEVEQITLGHKTLKSVTSRKPKQELITELSQKVKRLLEERDSLMEIQRMTEILLVKKQIAAFKRFKRETFRNVLKQSGASMELLIPQMQAFWSLVLEETRTLLK